MFRHYLNNSLLIFYPNRHNLQTLSGQFRGQSELTFFYWLEVIHIIYLIPLPNTLNKSYFSQRNSLEHILKNNHRHGLTHFQRQRFYLHLLIYYHSMHISFINPPLLISNALTLHLGILLLVSLSCDPSLYKTLESVWFGIVLQ